jgi:hypothetical protein
MYRTHRLPTEFVVFYLKFFPKVFLAQASALSG